MESDGENDSDYSQSRFNDCDIMRFQLQFLSDPFYREPQKRTFITALYSTVALVGAIGNLMVIAAVLRNAQMRTPRNYFIINLAMSDLLMCTLTVPFTMYYVLNQFWGLGPTACKLVASAQGVNIFVSTMSITAIGLDRYWVIIFPTKTQQQRFVIAGCFTVIWIASFLLAFPLFYATDATLPLELKDTAEMCGIVLFVCSENWRGMIIDKGVYSISSTVFQYVLPLTMLTFAYTRIIWRLENRMANRQRAVVSNQLEYSTGGSSYPTSNNRRAVEQRQRRTNLLLICLVAFFAICWLPLNLYNSLSSFELANYSVVVFVTCHAFGMMSACANPILYGVFNENFRTEFVAILTFLKIIPVYEYLGKKVLPGRFGNSIDNETNDRSAGTSVTRMCDRFVSHTVKKESTSKPITHQRRASSLHDRKPRAAQFQQCKSQQTDGDSAVSPVDQVSTKVANLVSSAANGCCSGTVGGSDGQGVERGILGQLLPISDHQGQVLSEETIPLFWRKPESNGGNVKSYTSNAGS